jgi:cytosine deaminase
MHELRAAGVPVLLGADNVSDPFFSMGTYDALDVLRNASVAAHLVPADWLDSITTNPAKAMGLDKNEIRIGCSADFILIKGCSWEEALRNPKVPRQVFRAGFTESVGKAAA